MFSREQRSSSAAFARASAMPAIAAAAAAASLPPPLALPPEKTPLARVEAAAEGSSVRPPAPVPAGAGWRLACRAWKVVSSRCCSSSRASVPSITSSSAPRSAPAQHQRRDGAAREGHSSMHAGAALQQVRHKGVTSAHAAPWQAVQQQQHKEYNTAAVTHVLPSTRGPQLP